MLERDPSAARPPGPAHPARAVLETPLEALVAMDAGGFITGWNRQSEATFGWTSEEAIGRVLADTIIPARYREQHLAGLDG